MAGFNRHSGKIAVIDANDIDTDRIIPARFLSIVTKSGFGDLLFHDIRGPEFALDQPGAEGSSILVAGANFGCGSSREHAVWAIQQAGFACVIAKRTETAPAYSDIFRQNAANCGLLLVELDENSHQSIVSLGSGEVVEVDLDAQVVRIASIELPFDISPMTREALMKGLDLIGTTMELESAISSYEKSTKSFVPKGVDVV